MKKIAILLAAALLAAAPLAAGCNGGEKADLILKVCNWEDYIDENVIADFEEEMSEKYGKSARTKTFITILKSRTAICTTWSVPPIT